MGKSKSRGDFERKKNKVGKKKVADNATNINIKSKAVILREQAIGEKGDVVNERNLTLKELLSQAKHYSANVRKDAVNGIRDIVSRHPHLLGEHLGSIIERVIPIVLDPEDSVRGSAHVLIKYLVGEVESQSLSSFVPIMIMYLSSSLTHLDEDVRLDGLKFLDVLVAGFPRLISSHSKSIAPHFVEMLGTGRNAEGKAVLSVDPTAKSSKLKARQSILESIHRFLLCTTSGHEDNDDVIVTNCSNLEWNSGLGGLRTALNRRHNDLVLRATSVRDRSGFFDDQGQALDFVNTLLPVLLELWMECTPAEAHTLDRLNTMTMVMNTIRLMLNSVEVTLRDSSVFETYYKNMKKYVAVYFPFGSSDKRNQMAKVYANLNSITGNALVYFLETGVKKDADEFWIKNLVDYLHVVMGAKDRSLSGIAVIDSEDGVSFGNVLPIIKRVLTYGSAEQKGDLLRTFTTYYERCHHLSSSKQTAISFISELLQAQNEDHSALRGLPIRPGAWLSSIPKLLWQLPAGESHEHTTRKCLRMLLDFAKRATGESIEQNNKLQKALIPYLYAAVQSDGRLRHIYGPFSRLPEDCQLSTIDLMYYFSSVKEPLVKAFIKCYHGTDGVSANVVNYMFEMMFHRKDCIPMATQLSFVLSILVGDVQTRELNLGKRKGQRNQDSQAPWWIVSDERQSVIQSCCVYLQRIGMSEHAAELLLPKIVEMDEEGKLNEKNRAEIAMFVRVVYGNNSSLLKDETHPFPRQTTEWIATLMSTILTAVHDSKLSECVDTLLLFRIFPGILPMVLNRLRTRCGADGKGSVVDSEEVNRCMNVCVFLLEQQYLRDVFQHYEDDVLSSLALWKNPSTIFSAADGLAAKGFEGYSMLCRQAKMGLAALFGQNISRYWTEGS